MIIIFNNNHNLKGLRLNNQDAQNLCNLFFKKIIKLTPAKNQGID